MTDVITDSEYSPEVSSNQTPPVNSRWHILYPMLMKWFSIYNKRTFCTTRKVGKCVSLFSDLKSQNERY